MFLKHLIVSFGLVIATSIPVSAQGWRGIVPLKSNCETVKRSLGIAQCRTGTYQFSEGSISISFSDGTCRTGWNVPAGTVISFYLHTKSVQKLDEALPDLSKYVKSSGGHVRGITNYTNADEGVTITAQEDGTISSIFYGPTTKDSTLRCSSDEDKILEDEILKVVTASQKFDEFGVLSKEDEHLRLNDFAFLLNAWPGSRAYILASPGTQTKADALDRIARIRAYLVEHGIAESRILWTTGGKKEESTIELYMVLK
jgi:hypothetical protein